MRVDSPSTHSIDGYNGSLERQEGVKVPDKKAKLTPPFQTKSKEGFLNVAVVLSINPHYPNSVNYNYLFEHQTVTVQYSPFF